METDEKMGTDSSVQIAADELQVRVCEKQREDCATLTDDTIRRIVNWLALGPQEVHRRARQRGASRLATRSRVE